MAERCHHELADPLREPFELDRHRIIESAAFRRLEGKTQVFAPSLSDHFRTRLTHTLEVASIARTLAKGLGANIDLAEAITLAHDLGHPPFGHAGEKALNEVMAGHGGFDHNAHSLRVVEYLEHPFPAFRGLNLTRATLDGLRAHCTRYDRPGGTMASGGHRQSSQELVSVEAQVASLADRIAYNCHDLEDAIGAGFFGLPELDHLTLWREAYAGVGRQWTNRSVHAIRRGTLDAMLQRLLTDVIAMSAVNPGGETSAPAEEPAVRFSPAMEILLTEVEQFLLDGVYRQPKIVATDADGQRMIRSLFAAYQEDLARLPERFASRVPEQGPYRVICDYIAGMTDRYCAREHEKLCRP